MIQSDEKGFTLVELVISMGMFSVVMLAILIFMTTGTRSYGTAKNELNLLMESQMLPPRKPRRHHLHRVWLHPHHQHHQPPTQRR